jgi:hypothetical protein
MMTFLYAWLQVSLIALNTYQIASGEWAGALLVGFLISFVWTFNVKRVAFGCWKVRILYSTGAACGTGTGILLANLFYS